MGVKTVAISGGEPLCYSQLETVLQVITRMGLNAVIYTSALTRKQAVPQADVWSNVKALGKTVVRVNFVSTVPRHYEAISRGNYEAAKTGAQLIVNTGAPLEAHVVVTRANLGDITTTIADLLSWGAKKVKLLRFVPQGRGWDNRAELSLGLSSDVKETLAQVEKQFEPWEVEIGLPFGQYSNVCEACDAGLGKLVLTPQNRLVMCSAFKGVFGAEVREQRLWRAMQDRDYYEQTLSLWAIRNKCAECKERLTCMEMCPAQMYYCQKEKEKSG